MRQGLVSALALLVASATAQQSAYGQCGGTGYTGVTSCTAGYVCSSENPYYYQCVAGTATSSAATTSTSTVVKTTSTSSVVSLHPLELRAGPGSSLADEDEFQQEGGVVEKRRHGQEGGGNHNHVVAGAGAGAAAASSSSEASIVTSVATSSSSAVTSTTSATTKTTSSVATKTSTSSAATGTSTSSTFAKTDGLFFNIDGETKYYAGTNCYWCSFLTSDTDVDTVFSHMATAGFKIIRVWGFNDVTAVPSTGTVYFQYLSASGSTINTGEYGLERLDSVVAAAETYGLKLIINFVNNWSDYGGIAAYTTAFGCSATTWFTDTTCQGQYQKYIDAVVSRYKTSTAIFAWELANEPRCSGCDTSVIYNWATNTSAYIKSLDSNHMVTMGDEGFGPLTGSDGSYPYTTSAGGYTWADNLNITDLDFGTFHLYPDSWGEAYSWGDLWVTTHGAGCVAAGKPCYLEEYGGGNNCTVENPWQQYALNTTGIAGDSFWQYGDVLPSCDCETSDDGNTVFYETGDWDCMVADHIDAINALYP